MAKLIWGSDLYKGYKLDKNTMLSGSINDIIPFQMLSLEEKTIDWIKAVADFYETVGWNNVERRAPRLKRNYKMRYGQLDNTDYLVNATAEDMRGAEMFIPRSPLKQFYPLAPAFVDVLRGEFIKRDNRWTIETIDPFSIDQAFQEKEGQMKEILMEMAMVEKQQTLSNMGLSEEVDPEQYQQQMSSMMERFQNVELQSKGFRTTAAKWAEKVLKIHEKRYNLHELEPDAFECGLITDSEFWHLDMMEDDFKLELLNPVWCDYHKGPNVKYVSEGDYFLWFDFMSAGDIVNKLGRRMKEVDLLKLRDIYTRSANILIPDYAKSMQGAYYDLTKGWTEATDLNPRMNDAMLGYELAYNYTRNPNFDHNLDADIFNPSGNSLTRGTPQMFRVMRLYWRSLKKVGWLTSIEKDGTVNEPVWIDENFKVTVTPKYDKSLNKEETKDNLIYGEHVDWTWVPAWRHVIKISPNQKHTFWMNSGNTLDSIYIDGAEIPFQFKGRSNPFEALPPIEGCLFSYLNTEPHSFIDRMSPYQIIFNICMNKVPGKFLKDYGNKVAIDRRLVTNNHAEEDGTLNDPIDEYDRKLRESDILDYHPTRESMEGLGTPAMPTVLQLSTIQEASLYLQAADMIKWQAAENVGITRQRLGGQKASETATGIQQGINYSETQTEKYFEQHSNLMVRVRQRMLDAAQYFATFKPSSRDIYMNSMEETVMVSTEGMENLLTHFNINLETKANVRAALSQISQFLMNENTLPIKASAKMESIIESSIPKILSVVKNSEYEQEQIVKDQQMAEQQAQQAQQEQAMQMEQAKMEREDMQADLDRQSNERIAEIRALGGLQSDIDADGQIDSAENLAALKQNEIASKRDIESQKVEQARKASDNQVAINRERNLTELQKQRMKSDTDLKVAKENKNKYDK